MASLAEHRAFYADLVCARGGARDGRIRDAFAAVPRERFCAKGPWQVFAGGGYLTTPSDDPAWLYQDILIGLIPERGVNNGEPSLHARCLEAVAVQPGDRVAHIGAGTGYYTAILAMLAGPDGVVDAYEIDAGLAQDAARNLAAEANVAVHARSATEPPFAAADVVYVSAGTTGPLPLWLDALAPRGRLILPVTPEPPGMGGMLLVTRDGGDRFAARLVCNAAFIPCSGARDAATGARLAEAFRRGDAREVRSLRRDGLPDASCWVEGQGWWLSTRA